MDIIMKNTRRLTALLLATACAGQAGASIIVDGSLADWGVNPTTWMPAAGIHYTIEDATGAGAYYLNPGWGGQAYDAEALYATMSGGKLFIALATGHNPLTVNNPGANSFGAGDFAIDFGKNGSYELGINIRPDAGFGLSGGVYSNPAWAYGLWNAAGGNDPGHPDLKHPTSLTAGSLIGNAQLSYTTTGVAGYGQKASDLHFFYEMSVDLDLLRTAGWDGTAFNIHWTEYCANDSIMVDPGFYVSEPGSMALLFAGMFGLFGVSRRNRRLPTR